MSLILDALKRANEDRDINEKLSLDEQISTQVPDREETRNRYFLLFLVTLSILVLVLIAVFFMYGGNDKNSDATKTIADPSPRSNEEIEERTASAKEASPLKNPSSNLSEQKDSVKSEESAPTIFDLKPRATATLSSRKTNTTKTSAPSKSVTELYETEEKQIEIRKAGEKTQNTTVVASQKRPEKPKANDSIADFKDIVLIKDLRESVKSKIPTLLYSEHIFANSAGSYIVINGKERTAGDNLAAGVTIQQILSDGIIAKVGQERFKIKALSSWINY